MIVHEFLWMGCRSQGRNGQWWKMLVNLVWWPWWHPQQKREFSILSSRFYIVQIKNLDHKRINTAVAIINSWNLPGWTMFKSHLSTPLSTATSFPKTSLDLVESRNPKSVENNSHFSQMWHQPNYKLLFYFLKIHMLAKYHYHLVI